MYKVVRLIYGLGGINELVSASVKKKARVVYSQGKVTYPPYFAIREQRGLLVFDTLINAAFFSAGETHFQIWECEITNPREPKSRCATWELETLGWFKLASATPIPWPTGTVEVDTVKLIRQVQNDEITDEIRNLFPF